LRNGLLVIYLEEYVVKAIKPRKNDEFGIFFWHRVGGGKSGAMRSVQLL